VDTAAFAVQGPERDRVFALMRSIDHEMVMADTRVLLTWLDRQEDVQPGALGTLGYCMGGGYALTAAGTFPERVAAAASIHGGWLATDRPDSPHRLAPRTRASLYIGVAGVDPLFPPDECARFERALRDAGCRFTIEVYEGAKHGFSVSGHPAYDRLASERHWDRLVTHFGATLGPVDQEAL
jgi:carboxymethylenebutenolidase